MIRPLRKQHRFTFYALAVLLPAIFIAGLAVRRPIPPSSIVPGTVGPSAAQPGSVRTELRVVREEEMIDLVELRRSNAPDPLIYWSRTEPNGNDLGADAVLLGSLSRLQGGVALYPQDLLPPAAGENDGYLIIYSLAQQRVVTVRPWPKGGSQ